MAETVEMIWFRDFILMPVSVKLNVVRTCAAWEYRNLLPRDETAADTTAELGCGLMAARVL